MTSSEEQQMAAQRRPIKTFSQLKQEDSIDAILPVNA